MNKKLATILSSVFILICIGYIAYDIASGRSENPIVSITQESTNTIETNWAIEKSVEIGFGELNCVAVSENEIIYCGGNSFIASYNKDFQLLWNINTEQTIYALAEYNGFIYAAGQEEILVFDSSGTLIDTWGPYDDDAMLTSISANKDYIAFADAGNLLVFVVDKTGALKSIIGHPGTQFIIPSAYFDVHLNTNNTIYIANTGKRQIELRDIKGDLISSFGEEGDDFNSFCGCCNPSHFDLTSEGDFITAEKGINRLKVLHPDGSLLEPLAQPPHFLASVPVDISVSKTGSVFAANSYDSKIYVFTRY